jgi:hypothetical protein
MPAPPHPQEAHAGGAAAVEVATPAPRTPWTIVFERPESCGDSCSRVLETLNAVARDPASGIPDGDARVVVRAAAQPARDLIVLDADGQPAGFISHLGDPGRIVAGLATLRASHPANAPLASR